MRDLQIASPAEARLNLVGTSEAARAHGAALGVMMSKQIAYGLILALLQGCQEVPHSPSPPYPEPENGMLGTWIIVRRSLLDKNTGAVLAVAEYDTREAPHCVGIGDTLVSLYHQSQVIDNGRTFRYTDMHQITCGIVVPADTLLSCSPGHLELAGNVLQMRTGGDDSLLSEYRFYGQDLPPPWWPVLRTFWNVYGTSCEQVDLNLILGLWWVTIDGAVPDSSFFDLTGLPWSTNIIGKYAETAEDIFSDVIGPGYGYDPIPINSDSSLISGDSVTIVVEAVVKACPCCPETQCDTNAVDTVTYRYAGVLEPDGSTIRGQRATSRRGVELADSCRCTFTARKLCRKPQ